MEEEQTSTQTVELSTDSLDLICRACLTLTSSDTSKFAMEYEGTTLCEIYKNCVSIEVAHDDALPQNLCNLCLEKLFKLHTFKKQCQLSENTLRSMVSTDEGKCRYVIVELLENNVDVKSVQTTSNPDIVKYEISHEDTYDENNTDIKSVQTTSNSETVKYEISYKDPTDENEPQENLKTANATLPSKSNLKDSGKSTNKKKKSERKYPCIHCSKLFNSTLLKNHMRIHTKEKPFTCRLCQKQFSQNCNLRRHIMTHTGSRPLICGYCGKGFIQTTSLAEHIRTHTGEKPFKCNYCGMQFDRSAHYQTHVRKHSIKRRIESSTTDKKNVNDCHVCHRRFTTKAILKKHMLTHGEKSFLCSYCGVGFVTKAGLNSHLKVHTGLKPFSCTECNKTFSQLAGLQSHTLIHTGEKPFVCQMCSKRFTQRTHLTYHMRTHDGQKPYVCGFCNKGFGLKGTLTVHIRTHTGETPYLCDVCNKGFYDSSSMKKHRRVHEQVKTAKCK